MIAFDVLYEEDAGAGLALPEAVGEIYGALALREDILFANFVASIDGVVAFEPAVTKSAGRLLSGGSPADRFLMGLLRACADAILVGAGTARDEAGHVWSPERAAPDAADVFAAVRRSLGLSERPEVFIATQTGRLDAGSESVRTSTVVTTPRGAEALPAAARATALILGDGDTLDAGGLVDGLRARGHRRILTEGGPRLLGAMLAGGHLDELFLTISPVVAGRDGGTRPGFVAGAALLPDTRVTGRLLSLRRSGDGLLFLRYALDG